MKIALITDLHLWFNRKTWDVINSHWLEIYNHLKDFKKYLDDNAINTIVFLWDIVDLNSENIIWDFAYLNDLFKEKLVYWVYWNNESFIESKKEISLKNITNIFDKKFFVFDESILIFLDIIKEAKENIFAEKKEIDFLEDALKNNFKKKKYIFMHYPISLDNENISYYHKERPDDCFPKNSKELRSLLEKYNVNIIFSWHTHFYYDRVINNIRHITIPSFSESNNSKKPKLEFAIFDLEREDLEVKSI